MSRKTKRWLVVAASLVLFGAVLFAAAMMALRWDFAGLSTVKYVTNIHEVSDAFRDISIITDTADVAFLPSEDDSCRVICHEEVRAKHAVAVENGTLRICVENEKQWYDYVGITMGTPKLTIYLPETDYGALVIDESTGEIVIPDAFAFESIDLSTSTGDIRIEGTEANALDLSVSTGKVTVTDVTCGGDVNITVSTGDAELCNVTCKNLISAGDTGDISLKNVVTAEKISIERSTGDVRFDSSDAAEIVVTTDTGYVTGTLRSEKVFLVESDTGSIEVPKTTTGGRCEIRTDTGDIRIDIP